VNVDGLRDISRVYGQEIADNSIRVLSGRLESMLETTGDASLGSSALACEARLARYDEHSFLIVLSGDQGRDGLRAFAESVIELLNQPMVVAGEEFLVRVSVGIAYYPEDADGVSELLRRAMLVATHSVEGELHNLVRFFDPQRDQEASQRMGMERALRGAVEQGGQLQPWFQPKISAKTGEVIGAEVLLRWLHPEMGMVSPGAFIPLAEETGLIHPISKWLFETVCAQVADWFRDGHEVGSLSINLSADSFFEHRLVQFVDDLLSRTAVPATQVIIELTESVLMRDAETARRVIGALRGLGVRVSLDDFGTGFSSLGYLNRFAIDEIKIDRSFITELEHDKRERALVQAVIDLGHALGLQVVAEGVETHAQAELLRQMGCDVFQGFLFAKPMPAHAFINFELREFHPGLTV
jgi:EAL domain-containing protein (putative c-di-GMP-specific phosphodiesterase class I)/GGDEF domain-containing protein